jgi:hypothetical protein
LLIRAGFGLELQAQQSGRAGLGPDFAPLGFFRPNKKPDLAQTMPMCSPRGGRNRRLVGERLSVVHVDCE